VFGSGLAGLGLTPAQFEQLSQQVGKSIKYRATGPVPVPSEQAPFGYIDRPELTGPLLNYLLSDQPAPAGRAIISTVHGLGGIGKTTVARWLIWRPEIEDRFRDGRIWVTLGNEPPDPSTIINNCVSQLEPTFKIKPTVDAARADLAALLKDRSVLFVIDDVWPKKSAKVAKALMVPSAGSRFLLTTRFPQLADDPDIRSQDFPLDAMNVDQARELIETALMRKLQEEEWVLAERLCEIVGGHPLALELAAARIKDGRSWKALLDDLSVEVARLEALDQGDDDLLAEHADSDARKRRTSVRASLLLSVGCLNRDGQRLFAWLGVVAENATITEKMAATLWSEEKEKADRHLRRLNGLGLLRPMGEGYGIHDLMHDLARDLLTKPEVPERAGDIAGFGLTLQDATRQFLARYRAQTTGNSWHTLPDDGYIHDHLVRHLEQAGWDREFQGLLWEESADCHCGWYQARERLGQIAGFLADVDRVWRHADRSAVTATNNEVRGKAISLQLHCALITASINSLSAAIPPEVLVSAVRFAILDLWSASALARQNPEPHARIGALLALAGVARQSDQRRVLGEALSVAHGIPDDLTRSWALANVAERLPAEEALAVARSIEDAGWRGQALANATQQLPAEEALAVARGIEEGYHRALALGRVAERLSAEQHAGVLGEALNVARSIVDTSHRDEVLTEIVRRLPAEEALAVARSINQAECRTLALAEIVQRLPAEEQSTVFDEALSAARSIPGPGSRDDALVEVAGRLPTEHALIAARCIDNADDRASTLAEVARRLPAEKQPSVLSRPSRNQTG
jgi:hypothetical protein